MASPEIIYTDSTSDIPKETVEELNIGMIPLGVTVDNEQFLDGETINTQKIIELMNAGKFPQTGSPGIGIIRERFEKARGKQIVSINISQGLSAVFNHAVLAAENINPTPYVISADTTSMALGFMVIEAARMKAQGKSPEEIQKYVESTKHRTVAMIALPTLTYIQKGGRISHLSRLMGNMLRIKPIIMVHEGKIEEVQQIRTWGNAKERLAEIILTQKFDKVAVMFGENEADADWLIGKLPVPTSKQILKVHLSAAILAHSGPLGLGVCGILTPDSPQLTPALAREL